MQFRKSPPQTPPPKTPELPVNVQFLNVPVYAPPPDSAEFFVNVQLFNVPPYTPPPKLLEEATLPEIVQLVTTAVDEPQYTPPPLLFTSPFVKVNPDRLA